MLFSPRIFFIGLEHVHARQAHYHPAASQGLFFCMYLHMYSIMTLRDHISMSFTDDKNCQMTSLKSGDLGFKHKLHWGLVLSKKK